MYIDGMTRLRLSALISLALLAGCDSAFRSSGPNVVVIVIDTLRADHLPFYGYPGDTAPFLSELAAGGAVFDQAYTTSSWTAPSTASLFTSLYPPQHGVIAGFKAIRDMKKIDPTITVNRIPEQLETLPELMRRAGYRTYGASDNFNVSELMGFTDGFDRFSMSEFEGAQVINEVLFGWAEEIRDDPPYFVYAHYIDPHTPYEPRAPWLRQQDIDTPLARMVANYDSEIRFVDEKIRELFEHFGWGAETLVIVVSDHGEEFEDHGNLGHGRTLYNEVLRIPFLVCGPGIEPVRITDPVSLVDVVPTLRTIVGVEASFEEQGAVVSPVQERNPAAEGRPLFGHVRRVLSRGGNTRYSVVVDSWKLIRSTGDEEKSELFDLGVDPAENNNLLGIFPERAQLMQDLLDEYEESSTSYASTEVRTTIDDAERERLRALGYVE
jgi:arylsulfatase A-like enzyme